MQPPSLSPQAVDPPPEPASPTKPIGSGSGPPSNNEPEEYKALSERKPAWAVFLVVVGIMMSLFLVALDRTIVSTVRGLQLPRYYLGYW